MFLILSCSCLCPIHWGQVLSREWRCSWSIADRRCSNYIWVINNFIVYLVSSYFRGLTVMSCWLHGIKSIPKPMLTFHWLHSQTTFEWNSIGKLVFFFTQENTFENVIYKMAAILFWAHVFNPWQFISELFVIQPPIVIFTYWPWEKLLILKIKFLYINCDNFARALPLDMFPKRIVLTMNKHWTR